MTDAADRIREAMRGAEDGKLVREVVVLDRCASTQDEAISVSGAKPGWVVVSAEQTGGRGRLGRTWAQAGAMGVAMSVTLDPHARPLAEVSLGAGVAAAEACERVCPGLTVRLRWPNDVVEAGPKGRKLAGVLIESRSGVVVVGIGVNVLQSEEHFPPGVAGVSLRMLTGESPDVGQTARSVLESLRRALLATPANLASRFQSRDVLRGTIRTFRAGGRQITGRVERIEPLGELVVVSGSTTHRLDALTTSLVHSAM